MAKYIRETKSMKAARLDEEEEFRARYPDGSFAYFEIDEPEEAVKPREPVQVMIDDDDEVI